MVGEKSAKLNLYRIMVDVCAGSHHHSVSEGEFGVVTIWVRASSMSAAFTRAGFILDNRRYKSIGTLHGYAEKLECEPLGCATAAELAREHCKDELLAGYDTLKESALVRADGLHEIWLGDIGHQLVMPPSHATAA